MIYKINKTKVSFYAEGFSDPFLVNSRYPNGDTWSATEAKAWAEAFVFAATNPDSEYVPGPSAARPIMLRSDLPEIPKPEVPEEDTEPATDTAEEVEDNAGTDAAG